MTCPTEQQCLDLQDDADAAWALLQLAIANTLAAEAAEEAALVTWYSLTYDVDLCWEEYINCPQAMASTTEEQRTDALVRKAQLKMFSALFPLLVDRVLKARKA